MKAGSFNIHDYLGKLYDNVNEEDLTLYEGETAEGAEKTPDTNGMIIPEQGKKAYDWLKKEFQKGKTEVKVEMSSHTFKPGYHLDTDVKTTNDFEPGMYGSVKTGETKGNTPKETPFPETKFPGGETNDSSGDKTNDTNKNESSENSDDKKQNGIKVEAKTKETKEKKEDSEDKEKKKKPDDKKE